MHIENNVSRKAVIEYILAHTQEYTVSNRITGKYCVLAKIVDENILMMIPWSTEKKVFKGRIYASNNNTVIEGDFAPSRVLLIFELLVWSFILILLSYFIFRVVIEMPNRSMEMIEMGIFAIIIFFVHIYYNFFYKSEKYEKQILEVLYCSLRINNLYQ